jgi:hypothetical protein
MPVVFRYKGIRFIFFSNEGDPREPIHIHAESPDGRAKFWLYPDVTIANSEGYSRKQLSELIKLVADHRQEIERAWNEYFG